MDWCLLSPDELIALSSALSLELSRGKTAEEILALRNLASQIAQTLFCIASQMQFCDKHCAKPNRTTFHAPESVSAKPPQNADK